MFFVMSCSDDENSDVEQAADETFLTITEEILELVNNHRNSIGLSSLSRNATADALSIEHTNYMISEGVTNHDGFGERLDQLRLEENATGGAENVAMGFSTAEAVVSGWLNSGGHRDNIEGNYTHTGIAAIQDNQGRYYFTQLFYR